MYKNIYNEDEQNLFRILIRKIIDIIAIRKLNKSLLVPVDSFMSVLNLNVLGECPKCKNKMSRPLDYEPLKEMTNKCANCGTKIYSSLMTIFLN